MSMDVLDEDWAGERLGKERFGKERFGKERFGKERFGTECSGKERCHASFNRVTMPPREVSASIPRRCCCCMDDVR
jgi:hypothetical protein